MPDRQVVILGAGFGGLYAALHLERALRRERSTRIVLLDKENYHLFVPMLHEITSGGVEPRHVVRPLRSLFRKTRVDFRRAEVRSIDLEGRRVLTDHGEVRYDYLVIALGSTTNFFGVEGAAETAFTLKNLKDAVRLRNHLVEMFERADLEQDPEARRRLLTFCLVGAGCTGVELATELQDLIRKTLLPNYPRVDEREVRLVLPEASGRIIPCVSNRLAWLGLDKLRRKGIEVRLHTPVIAVSESAVTLADGKVLPTETVVWTAGVKANPIVEGLPVEGQTGPRHRRRVSGASSVPGRLRARRLHPLLGSPPPSPFTAHGAGGRPTGSCRRRRHRQSAPRPGQAALRLPPSGRPGLARKRRWRRGNWWRGILRSPCLAPLARGVPRQADRVEEPNPGGPGLDRRALFERDISKLEW